MRKSVARILTLRQRPQTRWPGPQGMEDTGRFLSLLVLVGAGFVGGAAAVVLGRPRKTVCPGLCLLTDD